MQILSDIGHGITLLRREGFTQFLRRMWMYFNGQRLENSTKLATFTPYDLPYPTEILVFPKFKGNPLVSIIIPVYNQWEYTHACLYSILNNTLEIDFEVILADDNSNDETRLVCQYVENIRVIRNNSNLGFLLNCNNAAKLANGKYLVLLNNDTLVQPDWLKWLIKPIEERSDIGLVGSKLIFSTGQLQEAGGIVFSDGSAMNYGREDYPYKAEYNYVKDVDYCSGACICIKKSVWDKLDGFDPIFAPAYYEDTDIAMQIRSMGLRTIYQPKSVIVHFEGVSNGTDTSLGIKKKQVENQIVFYNKWKDELLKNNFKRNENLFNARDQSKHKQTILLVCYSVPDTKKSAVKAAKMVQHYIVNGFNIKFLPDNFIHNEPAVLELEQNGIEVLSGEFYKKNWQEWIKKNCMYLSLICFEDEFLSRKYLSKIEVLEIGDIKFNIYKQS